MPFPKTFFLNSATDTLYWSDVKNMKISHVEEVGVIDIISKRFTGVFTPNILQVGVFPTLNKPVLCISNSVGLYISFTTVI